MLKAVIEAARNEEMGSCRGSGVFSLPQTAPDRQESSSEAIKQNWVGSKFFLVKRKMIWLSAVL